ncbi:uncharacterized protein [Diadema antillarum]|uniref:uncharacterized protein n=1 Tax=Diadema antillarum TaxID=105358 RepID=UPI003A8A2935
MATFNIQTLTMPKIADGDSGLKTDELVWNMKKQSVEICGIQEHRQVHETDRIDDINCYKVGQGYELYTASAWRNTMQAAIGGVGIVIGKIAQRALIGVDRISDRLIKATFQGNPALTVIVAYAPCEYAASTDKTDFDDNLRQAIEAVPRHHFLMVLGDLNARLGPDDVLFTCNDQTNDNGRRLLDVMEEYQLLATNTLFQKRKGKLWTWMSPNKTTHQLDYILTRKKWRKSIVNSEAYGSFSSLGSDHRVVTATIRLSLRAPKKQKVKRVKYAWEDLTTDRQLQEQYAVEIRNRFHVLQEENESATETYQRFINANQQAAETCLKQIKKARREEQSLNPKVTVARKKTKAAYRAFIADKGEDGKSREEYARTRENLYRSYAILDQEKLRRQIAEVEQAHENRKYGLSWKLINDISGRKASQSVRIRGESAEKRVATWYSHFKNLLGNPPELLESNEPITPIFSDLPIPDGPFTMSEYTKAKAEMKNNKSSGEDGVAPEVLKYVPVDDIILEFINRSYEDGDQPEQWSTLNIIPVPKSGDLSQTDNYRGICLSSVVSKTYNRMILNRIRPYIDPLLRDSQNGFRQERSTVGQILALRRILEGVRDRSLPAVITFIDFKKAFDSIHRGKLLEILNAYGIPEKLVRAIDVIYSKTHAKVCSPDGETEYFEILAGVLQGDTLAPFLFIVALDYALRLAINGKEEELGFTLVPRQSRRVPPVMVTDLDFADDIALISDTTEKARELLFAVEKECKKIGLRLNAKKTKVMAFNIDDTTITTLDGAVLDVKNDFKYLGSWIASTEQDIRIRRGHAWNALHSMRKVWKSQLSDDIKRRLFVTTVESVLLYGAETWTLTARQEKALDGVYTRMLRIALNVSWSDYVRNDDLYGTLPKVSDKVRERRMRLAGHCVRHPELSANSLVLWEPKQGTAKRGRRKATLISVLKKDAGLESINDLRTVMLNREVWRRNFVYGTRVGIG